MTANGSMSEFYAAVCAQNRTETNPRVSRVLEAAAAARDLTLKLSANSRARPAQRLGDDDILALSKCLRGSARVTGVDLSYNNITDEGVTHLAELLQEDGSALRSLDLRFNDVQADGAERLAESLQCNCTLLALRLSGNKLHRGAMHLARTLQVNNSLQELQLAACDLDTQSVIALAIALKTNRTLRSLDVSRPLLFSQQEEWAVHVSAMLAVNSSLLELHLGWTGMSDAGVERLSDGLRLNRSLRHLDLRCNRVTRDGVRHLAAALKHNPTLQVLDLSSNRIEDEGAGYLSEAVARPGCGLRELSVCRNNIRTEGLLSLARAMKVNTTLSHVYIWGNHLEEPVCQAFSELIGGGRLPPEQTDVGSYEVDGRLFLAEVSNSLRTHSVAADDAKNTPSHAVMDVQA